MMMMMIATANSIEISNNRHSNQTRVNNNNNNFEFLNFFHALLSAQPLEKYFFFFQVHSGSPPTLRTSLFVNELYVTVSYHLLICFYQVPINDYLRSIDR